MSLYKYVACSFGIESNGWFIVRSRILCLAKRLEFLGYLRFYLDDDRRVISYREISESEWEEMSETDRKKLPDGGLRILLHFLLKNAPFWCVIMVVQLLDDIVPKWFHNTYWDIKNRSRYSYELLNPTYICIDGIEYRTEHLTCAKILWIIHILDEKIDIPIHDFVKILWHIGNEIHQLWYKRSTIFSEIIRKYKHNLIKILEKYKNIIMQSKFSFDDDYCRNGIYRINRKFYMEQFRKEYLDTKIHYIIDEIIYMSKVETN